MTESTASASELAEQAAVISDPDDTFLEDLLTPSTKRSRRPAGGSDDTIRVRYWPALPTRKRPDLLAGLRSAPSEKVSPRISDQLHWNLKYAFTVLAAELDLMELAPSQGCEWLTRIGLLHIDDPDLFRLCHHAGKVDMSRVILPAVDTPAGGRPADGWDHDLYTDTRAFGLRWPKELVVTVATTLRDWKVAHPVTVQAFGSTAGMPRQGFIEGLLRLGMKHVADPDAIPLLRR